MRQTSITLPRWGILCLALILGVGAVCVVIAGLRNARAAATALPGLITAQGRYLVRDGARFEVKGVNYYPKDYAWDRFWTSYKSDTTTAQINTELNLARALGINAIRIFLPYDHFSGTLQSAPHLSNLKDFVNNQLGQRGMVAIVTLFDFYTGPTVYSTTDYFSNTRHISAVVNTLGITNQNILAWDIKNELDRDYDVDVGESRVKAWAGEMISYTKSLDPNHLITLGFYGGVTATLCTGDVNRLVYSPAIAAEFAPQLHFISVHYFVSERCFESDIQTLRVLVGEKPIILEEFGLHTWATSPTDPKTEKQQAAFYNAVLSLSEAYDLSGYSFWTLTDFSYILAGDPQQNQCQGILRNRLVNICEMTTTVDYSEKLASETIRRHYHARPLYIDLGDSWVDASTHAPPPGWTDDFIAGGVLMRGYNISEPLWSHDYGKVALSKWVEGGVSITGTAKSPLLSNANVNQYPFLTGEVYSYSIRYPPPIGSDATLYVGVQEGSQITRLLTVTHSISLPYAFTADLRKPPTSWSGTHSFRIVLELVPDLGGNGYSATYELDWISIQAPHTLYLPLIRK